MRFAKDEPDSISCKGAKAGSGGKQEGPAAVREMAGGEDQRGPPHDAPVPWGTRAAKEVQAVAEQGGDSGGDGGYDQSAAIGSGAGSGADQGDNVSSSTL